MALTETLQDNFNDNSFDTAKWDKFEFTESGSTSIAETNGRLEFTFTPGHSDGYVISDATYDFVGSYIFCEIAYYTSLANIKFYMAAFESGATYTEYRMSHIDGSLIATRDFGAGVTTLTTVAFNPTAHRWWRIREASNVIRFETSPDSNTWTQLTSTSNFSRPLSSVQPYMYGVGYGVLSTTTMAFDNFNRQYIPFEMEITGGDSITGSPDVVFYISASIDGETEILAIGSSLADQSQIEKTYLYKVYDQDDNFLGIWHDVISDLTFDHELYSAGSTVLVDLARNSDSRVVELEDLHTTSGEVITTQDSNSLIVGYESTNSIGPGSNVDVNYRVEIWVFYGEITELSTTSGELILTQDDENIQINFGGVNGLRKFHGYITRYVSRYGGNETVQVALASFGADLDNHVLESGSNTTVAYSSQDPSNILKDALDKFTAVGGLIDYTESSVEISGTTVTYTFRLNTYLEVLKKSIELAPYDWYWYVGLGDDTVYFAEKPTTTSHTFILGKHLQELDVEYSIEDITNKVYFVGGEISADTSLFKKYTDSASITNYRQGLQRITDHRVTLDASADLISEAEIDRNNVPRYRSSVTILENAYNIEEITLGQLVTFRNFGNYIDTLELQIVGLSYQPDRVTLQLDTLLPSVNKRIEDLRRNMIELDNQQTPTAPS